MYFIHFIIIRIYFLDIINKNLNAILLIQNDDQIQGHLITIVFHLYFQIYSYTQSNRLNSIYLP